MLPSRRETALGGLLTVFGGSCTCHANVGSARTLGCYVPKAEAPSFFARTRTATLFASGNEQIEPRSGDPQLDKALAQTLSRLARLFDILPAFSYYRDDTQENALATPERRIQTDRREDGTVLFGLNMLRSLLTRPEHPDACVVAVAAHEFGHIVSFKHLMLDRLIQNDDPYRAEQFADYLAGYYAGYRKKERSDFPAVVFARTQRSFGGVTRGTHGTADERGQAVVEGFKAVFERGLSAPEAIEAAFQFAMARR